MRSCRVGRDPPCAGMVGWSLRHCLAGLDPPCGMSSQVVWEISRSGDRRMAGLRWVPDLRWARRCAAGQSDLSQNTLATTNLRGRKFKAPGITLDLE